MESIECKEVVKIDDGNHEGVIIRVQRREKPFDYTDIVISLNSGRTEIKKGFPTYISKENKLGRLLTALGVKLEVGNKYDPEALLVGKRVRFMTLNVPNKDGKEYAHIVDDSIKLAEEVVK